jgi:hypothetical protein
MQNRHGSIVAATGERLMDVWNLHTTRRAAGGMMERWEKRWSNNVTRYENLECVKLILPWSTPAMRYCTLCTSNDTFPVSGNSLSGSPETQLRVCHDFFVSQAFLPHRARFPYLGRG